MVLEKGLEILLTITAEQKSIDSWTKFLEGKIGGREQRAAEVSGGVVEGIQKTSFNQTKFKGAKFSGEELNNIG